MTYKDTYEREGFVIIHGLLASSQLIPPCDRVIERTRRGDWLHRRTVGSQFPPYNSDSPDSWGVQHLMHPDLGEPAFAEWYTSDALLNVVQELLQSKAEDLQMELFNLLINPTSRRFHLSWHRDDIKATATEDEERVALGIWHYGVASFLRRTFLSHSVRGLGSMEYCIVSRLGPVRCAG